MMYAVYIVWRTFYLICMMLIGLFGSNNQKEN